MKYGWWLKLFYVDPDRLIKNTWRAFLLFCVIKIHMTSHLSNRYTISHSYTFVFDLSKYCSYLLTSSSVFIAGANPNIAGFFLNVWINSTFDERWLRTETCKLRVLSYVWNGEGNTTYEGKPSSIQLSRKPLYASYLLLTRLPPQLRIDI